MKLGLAQPIMVAFGMRGPEPIMGMIFINLIGTPIYLIY